MPSYSLQGEHNINEEIKKVLKLRELEHATQLLLAAAKAIPLVNPYDYVA
jgi:hypothetical protein